MLGLLFQGLALCRLSMGECRPTFSSKRHTAAKTTGSADYAAATMNLSRPTISTPPSTISAHFTALSTCPEASSRSHRAYRALRYTVSVSALISKLL